MSCNMELNNTYIVSQDDLATIFCKDKRTIKRAIQILKERDFVYVYKFQRQNVYFINPRIFCKVSANYKKRLIDEYTKLSEPKERPILHLDVLKNAKQYLVLKTNFAKEHHELDRPSNMQIYKQNQIIKAISNLTDEQLNVLFQLTNSKALSDKELQKMQKENEQMQKSNKATEEYLKTLQQQQELKDRLDSYKRPETEEPINAFSDLYNPDDPTGIIEMSEQEINPLDYITDYDD